MAWTPTLLEDSLDPWLAIEPNSDRRRAVLEFLLTLCEHEGDLNDAVLCRARCCPRSLLRFLKLAS